MVRRTVLALAALFVTAAVAIAIAISMALPGTARAGAVGSPDEATALVEKAIAHYDSKGRAAALADFSNPQGGFNDRDLYVIVADMEGVFLAHGVNRGLIDKNLMELKDVNGKHIVRAMVESGKAHPGGGWVEYVWTNPTTKKLDPKKTWVKAHDGLLFMVGVYDTTKG